MAKLAKELLNDPFNDGTLTGSLASDNMWIKWVLAISLGLFALLIISLIVSYLLRLLDFKSPKIDTESFKRASRIDIDIFEDEKVCLKKGSQEFEKFISFFNDKQQDFHEHVHSVRACLYIDMKRYSIEFSNEGWNFVGESKNSRELDNPLALILFLENLEEEYDGRQKF